MTADTPRLRLGILAIVALSLFAALFARLWYLQILSAGEYQLQAESNSIREILEPAPRGRILDRHGRVLVDNRASNVVAVDRAVLEPEDTEPLLERLSAVLEIPADVLGKRLRDQRVSPYTPVPVADDVAEEKMTHLLEQADRFPAVVAKRVAVRTYPQGNLAAHVLGYVGQISEKQLEATGDEYALGDIVGQAGVEKVYERYLKGEKGKVQLEVDATGKPLRVIDRDPPVQGHDVVLTVDIDVQRTAEDGLREGLLDTQGRRFEDDGRPLVADAGAAVVLDAKAGGILAMASYPTFDLPGLADGISAEEGAILFPQDKSAAAPFLNRAITGQYAPGSTWKIVTADAALRSGMINSNFSLVDGGTYTIPGDCSGRGCLRRNAGSKAWGRVGVQRSMAVSSDVFYYTIGGRFWQERARFGESPIQDVAEDVYGFGAQTQVPLPAESAGRVLTPERRAQLYEEGSPLVSDPNWYTGQSVSLAIGQDAMVVTPIQIAGAYAVIANGGTRFQPNIALRVQRQDGTLIEEFAPRTQQIDLPPQVRDPIVLGLRDVVSSREGTAYNAFAGFPLAQYGVAGKTGTAQAPPKQDTALFAAYGPTQDPQHVVTVVMEQSGFGASAAAPVARRIFGTLSGLEQGAPAQFTQVNGVGD
jgi:penicillin-binding protein 2